MISVPGWIRRTGPGRPYMVLTVLLSLGLARAIYDKHYNMNWKDFEQVARKVQEVTPPRSNR